MSDPTSYVALDRLERLIRKAELDSRLLDGRDFKFRRYAEAYRMIDLLRGRADDWPHPPDDPEPHPPDWRKQ